MKKSTSLAIVLCLSLALTPTAHAWISFLDGSEDPELILDTPWTYYVSPTPDEGSVQFVDLGGGNMALRLDSPAHSDGEYPGATIAHANEYYTFRNDFGTSTENVGTARFRLVDFTSTGKENLLSVLVNGGGGGATGPAITLVDGNYWVWSYTSNESILDLGPAVAGDFHEAYIMARNNGTAKVWWDGAVVLDGPVPVVLDQADYVEFGSGTYWQTTAGTTVDFDWVGWGDMTDMPVPLGVAGDYNDDGSVDAADYVLWRNGGPLQNEVETPGTVTQEDYDAWRARFGNIAGAAGGQANFASATVPEPLSSMLIVTGVSLFAIQRWRAVTRSPS